MNKMKKYYIAYGSNLNLEQMKRRCPDAKLLGTGTIKDYGLLFRGSPKNAVATTEPLAGSKVPVGVFEISEMDEMYLDRYEGYPHLYYKDKVDIEIRGEKTEAMIYLMHPKYEMGMPSRSYYQTIRQGYIDCGFDISYLNNAVKNMQTEIEKIKMQEKYPLGYKDIRQ